MATKTQDHTFKLTTEENGKYGVYTKTVTAKDKGSAFKAVMKELGAVGLLEYIVTIDYQQGTK
jgi:hypothetical protein